MKRSTMLTGAGFLFFYSMLYAAIPQLINFQGILKDGSGNPVADGNYAVIFRMYSASAAGTLLWAETTSVATSAGAFNVHLGAVNAIPDSVFNSPSRWLGIKVSADPEMTPRQQLVSGGYSYRVNSVDNASGGTITSKVSIGPGNINSGTNAFVAGEHNNARGNWSTVSGGGGALSSDSNSAVDEYSTVGGGTKNAATDFSATVGGGYTNIASGHSSTVAGGNDNVAGGSSATIGGGAGNRANTDNATVGGGTVNSASGIGATVSGGAAHVASGVAATITGGGADTASGRYSTACGGYRNLAAGHFSFAAGRRAKAANHGTFVWADSSVDADFASTADNQFLIRAAGGVGIGTNSPFDFLHVKPGSSGSTGSDPFSIATFESGGNGYLSVLTPQASERGILFGDAISNVDGGVVYVGASDRMEFRTNGNNTRMSVTSTGSVGIGTTTPTEKLQVVGNICVTGTVGVCSDARFKQDVQPIRNSLDVIEKLQGVRYHWNREQYPQFTGGDQIGFLAQEVKKVLPELVSEGSDGTLSVDYGRFSAVLLQGIKEQQQEIEELKSMILDLQAERQQPKYK